MRWLSSTRRRSRPIGQRASDALVLVRSYGARVADSAIAEVLGVKVHVATASLLRGGEVEANAVVFLRVIREVWDEMRV